MLDSWSLRLSASAAWPDVGRRNRGLLGNTLINDGFSSMPRLITAKYLDLYIASEDVDVLSTQFQNSETLPHLCRLLVSILYYLGNSSPSHVFFVLNFMFTIFQ